MLLLQTDGDETMTSLAAAARWHQSVLASVALATSSTLAAASDSRTTRSTVTLSIHQQCAISARVVSPRREP